MKKVVFILPVVFLLVFAVILSAVDECEEGDEACKIKNARECLDVKSGDCSSSFVNSDLDKIFLSLSIDKCTDDFLDSSDSEESCWPAGNCDLKTTAQAVIVLEEEKKPTTNTTTWLLSKSISYTGLDWYLQIDSTEETQCVINYSESSHTINIGVDKKIDTNAGNCLTRSQEYDNYWLEINPDCYGEDFLISCNKGFLTSKLFTKGRGSTIYVTKETKEVSAGATINERVVSSCFGIRGTCDYEGSLWAAYALSITDNDFTQFRPYLIVESEKEENQEYLPESFLYAILGGEKGEEYKTRLLSKQKTADDKKFWDVSDGKYDRYYDTALALLPFQSETNLEQKKESKDWLLSDGVQGSDGCWDNGNIANTGFILYSLFGKGGDVPPGPLNERTCRNNDGNCASSCEDGETEILGECSSDDVCCGGDSNPENRECERNGGECFSSCSNEGKEEILGECSVSGEVCCKDGGPDPVPECEEQGKFCVRSLECRNVGGLVDRQLDSSCHSVSISMVCCNKNQPDPECKGPGKEVCSADQQCDGISDSSYPDLRPGERCCTGGTGCFIPGPDPPDPDATCDDNDGNCASSCEDGETEISGECSSGDVCCKVEDGSNECENNNGRCKYECRENEREVSDECSVSGEVCCKDKSDPNGGPKIWLIILLIVLIILVVLGIVFREKLMLLFDKIRNRGNDEGLPPDGGFPGAPPGGPPPPPGMMPPIQRRMPMRRPMTSRRNSAELDDVLTKLKSMGEE